MSRVSQHNNNASTAREGELGDITIEEWLVTKRQFHDAACNVVSTSSLLNTRDMNLKSQVNARSFILNPRSEEAAYEHAETGIALQDITARLLESYTSYGAPSLLKESPEQPPSETMDCVACMVNLISPVARPILLHCVIGQKIERYFDTRQQATHLEQQNVVLTQQLEQQRELLKNVKRTLSREGSALARAQRAHAKEVGDLRSEVTRVNQRIQRRLRCAKSEPLLGTQRGTDSE
ncbi:hypothetical protein C8Q76DRAFT_692487 [Earliella scabrosa]|nr:hypothetical protein C8Q76DRAFT_692487 [Earliella scabrosa]